jgi:DNA adenine methylase
MNSPLAWPGGKKNLVKRLLALLPPHRVYVEPFCGSAKLLFAKEPAPVEVISDANGDLINFFLVAKHRPCELAQRLQTSVAHPAWFKRLKAAGPCEDEVSRAFRFAYLNWFSFGAKGTTFTACRLHPRKALRLVRQQLLAVSKRCEQVLIECSDYGAIVARYDSPQTFFYCDPPYVSFHPNNRYVPLVGAELDKFFDVLAGIKGKFLMSEQDCAEVRHRADARHFVRRRIGTEYSLNPRSSHRARRELLIANFKLGA